MTPHDGGPGSVAVNGNQITGRRLSTRSVRYRVALYARRAGIVRRVSPHALRHAALTHSLATGANILKVKERLLTLLFARRADTIGQAVLPRTPS